LLVTGTVFEAEEPCITLCFSGLDAATYLAGGYLEEFTALSALAAGIPVENLGLNAHLDPLKPLPGRKSDDLNEIDVGVVWKARMLIIECKAGRAFTGEQKAQDILNKAVSIRNGYGGALATSLLVGNVHLPTWNQADICERAKVGAIELQFGANRLKDLPRWIARWAGLKSDGPAFDWNRELLPLADRDYARVKRPVQAKAKAASG